MFTLPNVPSYPQHQQMHLGGQLGSNGISNGNQTDYTSLGVNYKDTKFFNNEFLSECEKKYANFNTK